MTVPRRPIADILEQSRRELLDLTARNRLIHTPRHSPRASQIEIVGERSDEVFRRLVRQGQSMTFRPAASPKAGLLPATTASVLQTLTADPQDSVLQTALGEEMLARRLRKLFYDARTFEEEQGVGILYLALGFLTWYETPHSDPRHAPLVLIPVSLSRSSVRAQFRVSYEGDDLETNLSLQARLAHDFGIKLPDLPDADDLVCSDYFASVREAIAASQPQWVVHDDDIVLGFFSFSRLRMYRDLEAEQWPDACALTKHPLIASLLGSGFPPQPDLFADDEKLDPHLGPQRCLHVLDADSSQAAVIEEVRRGRNLVIQGPPGTGKSQTIANLIATAVHEGKRVLFVAEKMAALEVVQRRLAQVGLGPVCLELHSHKANKREVLAELARTLELGRPKTDNVAQVTEALSECLVKLNGHAERMHAPLGASGQTLYDVLGALVRLREQGVRPPPFTLGQAVRWTPAERHERRTALQAWLDQLPRIGSPQTHPWRGVRASGLLPTDGPRLASQAGMIAARLRRLAAAGAQLATALGREVPQTTRQVVQLAELTRRLLRAPPLDRSALADDVWEQQRQAIDALVAQGQRLARVQRALEGILTPQAWEADVASARRDLETWGQTWLRSTSSLTLDSRLRSAELAEWQAALQNWLDQLPRIGSPQTHLWRGVRAGGLLPTDGLRLASQAGMIAARLRRLAAAGAELATALGREVPQTTRQVVQLAELTRRLLKAPPLDRSALADDVWEQQRQAIDALVAQGQRLARVQRALEGTITPQAWEADVASARRDLKALGQSWLRWLSWRYRRALRTLEGLLVGPLPETLKERLAILDEVYEGQQAYRAVEAGETLGRRAFGTMWRGVDSDWAALEAICRWEHEGRQSGLPADFRAAAARLTNGPVLGVVLQQVRTELRPLEQELKELIQALEWDVPAVFSQRDPHAVPLDRLIAQLEACQQAPDELATWCAYHRSRQRVQELGLEALVQVWESGPLANAESLDQFDLAWCERPGRHSRAKYLEAGLSGGMAHERLIEQFRELDWQLLGLSIRYRRALRTLEGLLVGPLPETLKERLAILEEVYEGQQAYRAVEAGETLGRRAFGTMWHGVDSDWAALEAICRWEQEGRQSGLPADFRAVAARWTDGPAVAAALQPVLAELGPLEQELEGLIRVFDWDLPAVFSQRDPHAVPLDRLIAQLEACQQAPEELATWCAYHRSRQRVQELGLEEVLQAWDSGRLVPTELLDQFDLAWCEALVRHAQATFPELGLFEGIAHERLIDQFRELDRQRQLLARQQVALAHWERLPRMASEVGEVGLIRREIHKKRRHLPLRQLLKEAGRAVQQIKPVFLMSPLSVAQFLEPGAVEFDLLVMDEASQVRPVDALGAIARARQMVIVGDDRQLPPTRFFTRLGADGDADAEDEVSLRTGDLESILGLCVAAGLPVRMLRWHYRSRHPSLIAVSNQEFYEGRLLVVPSPQASGEPFGLRFHFLDAAVYDRGGTATNRLEAAAVAEAVLDFARRSGELSLGVGTFSVAQRDAILDALEERRREHPELEPFFAAGGPEPFFVKNLENIQGDERDVIFISVGYARDERGVLSMNFGPLTADGGHRRLNVLITRARQRCEVFSAITADDIDLRRTDAWGVRALKAFLQFARDGQHEAGVCGQDDSVSEFEQQVAQAVRRMGYEVVPQVQESRFFVDLAVVDPQQPQRYLLGIQCDGAAYRAARWARDRDRLRQQILQERGWRIHRIWSLDWFRQPRHEQQRLAEAIQPACQASTQPETREDTAQESASRPFSVPDQVLSSGSALGQEDPIIDRHAVRPRLQKVAVPYTVTTLTLRTRASFPDLPASEQQRIVRTIVQTEGPIHMEEICQRAAALTGMQRTGSRVKDIVEDLLRQGKWQGWLVAQGEFYSVPGQSAVLRDRSELPSLSLRNPAMVPPDELAAAILEVVQQSVAATPDEIAREVARLLGVKHGSALRQALDRQYARLQQAGSLRWQSGRWMTVPLEQRDTG